jgi:hypothetical protein
MGSIWDWSTTASSNGNADSGVNWLENQAAATVNNSARAMMMRIAELLKDIGGQTDTTGSSNAYLLNSSSAFTTYATGRLVGFKASFTNTSIATLNVNSIGERRIFVNGETLVGGEIVSGTVYLAVYDADFYTPGDPPPGVSSGGWHLLNPTVPRSWTLGADAIGQYSLMYNTLGSELAPGDETSGSNIRYANADNDFLASPVPTGTWKCLGRGSASKTTLFVKVA